ncbi:MAG: hypothetical protein NTU85_01170 [Candidatus Kaiserbacteria bacterium]|nr:hypothetical protein [Candidatus Kaiserbacteria bacterium]
MKYRFTTSGFTLVETLIVIALSVGMLIVLCMLIRSFNTSYSYEQGAAISAESARSVMRETESLTLVADHVLQSHTFSTTTYTSSSTVLVLEIPSIDSSGAIISSTYDYAVFYSNGTHAYRILAANAASKRVSGTKQLSDTISSLTFSYNNTNFTLVNTITVDVQTLMQLRGQSSIDHRSEQLYLRNF